jgi:hypothetical protein
MRTLLLMMKKVWASVPLLVGEGVLALLAGVKKQSEQRFVPLSVPQCQPINFPLGFRAIIYAQCIGFSAVHAMYWIVRLRVPAKDRCGQP